MTKESSNNCRPHGQCTHTHAHSCIRALSLSMGAEPTKQHTLLHSREDEKKQKTNSSDRNADMHVFFALAIFLRASLSIGGTRTRRRRGVFDGLISAMREIVFSGQGPGHPALRRRHPVLVCQHADNTRQIYSDTHTRETEQTRFAISRACASPNCCLSIGLKCN